MDNKIIIEEKEERSKETKGWNNRVKIFRLLHKRREWDTQTKHCNHFKGKWPVKRGIKEVERRACNNHSREDLGNRTVIRKVQVKEEIRSVVKPKDRDNFEVLNLHNGHAKS